MTLPTGTVTFLRSDIEGSMELVRALGARYDALDAEHGAIVRGAIEANDGQVVRTEGDAFFAVFTDAGAAARAAVDIQRALAEATWLEGHPVRVRIGIHSGMATRAGDDYGGFEVNRAARIAATGWGGQIVLSDAARALVAADLPAGCVIDELGRVRLKGVPEPERLFQLTPAGLPAHFPPLRSGEGAAEHLPARATSFVGREAELATLSGLLGQTRLLTLTGPGGTGKTTLAIELARRHAAECPDGTWFVDLQAVRDPDRVQAEIAAGLGLYDGPAGPATDRLDSFVSERSLLIVIDNFEQVVAAADVIDRLLAASPTSRVIATSRIPLRISAEQEFAVPPLALSDSTGDGEPEAVRLFIDRVRRVRSGREVNAHELEAVRETCRLLDGLPLAIELSASRAGALSIGMIHERLAARLPLPGTGPRDLPDRQRTIGDTVAWSYELLEPQLQRLFSWLAVFEESFDYEQAEAVCGGSDGIGIDVLDGLVQLAERSLLVRVDDAVGSLRYRMLSPIRSFALDRLEESGEAERVRERHALAYAALAHSLSPTYEQTLEQTDLARLEPDDGNFREAALWAIETGTVDVALELVASLWRYWVHSGRLAEGQAIGRRALSLEGVESAGEVRVWAVAAMGSFAYWSTDGEAAKDLYLEELALARESDVPLAAVDAWQNLLYIRSWTNDVEGATEAAREAERILTELGATDRLEALKAMLLATSAPQMMQAPEARLADYRTTLAELEASSDPLVQATLPALRSLAALAAGDYVTAAAQAVANLRSSLRFHRYGDLVANLFAIASVAKGMLGPRLTAAMIGAAENASERHGLALGATSFTGGGVLEPKEVREQLIETLGEEAFEQAYEEGRRMTLDELVGEIEDQAANLAAIGESAGPPIEEVGDDG